MWLQTLDGKRFDIESPCADAIDPNTLATVLSRIARFNGHSREFYSVAQHSVLVLQVLEPAGRDVQLAALLHDAHEAYSGFGDVCRMAKELSRLGGFDIGAVERSINAAVAERFGFPVELFDDPRIKRADNVALATEARDLMGDPPAPWGLMERAAIVPVIPTPSKVAECLFSSCLNELWR